MAHINATNGLCVIQTSNCSLDGAFPQNNGLVGKLESNSVMGHYCPYIYVVLITFIAVLKGNRSQKLFR